MSKIILLQTFLGAGDFRCWWECDGRKLTKEEAISCGVWSDEQEYAHKKSSYHQEWFELQPGTKVEFEHYDDRHEEDKYTLTKFILSDQFNDPPQNPWHDHLDVLAWLELHSNVIERKEI